MARRLRLAAFLLSVAAGVPAAASLQASIDHALREQRDGWIRWSVEGIASDSSVCCSRWNNGVVQSYGCRLESKGRFHQTAALREDPSARRGLQVFVRTEGGRPVEIASFSSDCPVDAGESGVLDLGQAVTEESVEWLSRQLSRSAGGDLNDALLSLSLHPGEAAERALLRAARDEPSGIRRDALFWVAQRAGYEALGPLLRAAREDPDAEVREAAVFAVSQLPPERAVTELIELARDNRYPEVREQAIFWLGQSDDPRSLDFLERLLLDD